MHDALVELVVYAIKEQYVSEKAFYTSQLGITPQSWDRWKKGQQGLKMQKMMKISALFTDYEWMLVKKVCRNATVIPEIQADPVAEFLSMKHHVAKKWVRSGLAEIKFKNENEEKQEKYHRKSNNAILQIEVNYDFWSYKDRIELRLPEIIRQQIESEKHDLLGWFHENAEEVLAAKKEEKSS